MRVSAVAGLSLLWCVALSACASPPAASKSSKPKTLIEFMGMKSPGLRGAALDAAVRTARAFPLGSEQNPVRTQGIYGQQRYIARLRCSDGRAPKNLGRGTGPPSPFGGVGDIYAVACPAGEPAKAFIHMDMYHHHVESRAVPGFTIVPD